MGDKKRRGWPFGEDDDFFAHFDELFEDVRRRMEKVFSGSMEDLETGKPFVWGYSFRVGPDGKPEFRQFGDTDALQPWTSESRREPLTDLIERGDSLSVTVELPGVEKDQIELRATPRELTISVENPDRRYYKEMDLPSAVDPDSVKATFRNGVLDITLQKRPGEGGKKVSIG